MVGDKTFVGGVTDTPVMGQLPPDLFVTFAVVAGPDQGMRFSLTKTHSTIGRQNGDIGLNDPSVSSAHACIEYIGTELYLVDMRSTNGTFVNGQKIEKAQIGNMDEVRVGNTAMVASIVRDVYGAYHTSPNVAPVVAEFDPNAMTAPRRQLPNPQLPPDLKISIVIVEGPDAGKQYNLVNMSTIIGRAEYADIQIKDESISRRHCQILIRGRDFMGLKDLASTNATFLNGRHVSAVQLSNNDLIKIGDTQIKFVVM